MKIKIGKKQWNSLGKNAQVSGMTDDELDDFIDYIFGQFDGDVNGDITQEEIDEERFQQYLMENGIDDNDMPER